VQNRGLSDFSRVARLYAEGHTAAATSRATGIPYSTVKLWRSRPPALYRRGAGELAGWRPPDARAYSYLLGLYFGDGHIVVNGRSAVLRLSMDPAYEGILWSARDAITRTAPGVRIARYLRRAANCIVLQAPHPVWPRAFPQHGLGVKHSRAIVLEAWQEEITRAYPRELIRGLIHSDGCRSINRFKTKLPSERVAEYEYVRYFFSNLSEDIKDIFCRHADLLGIRWSRANPRYVSIHDRKSVAILESFVGPKT
jgi:hypothetical protein